MPRSTRVRRIALVNFTGGRRNWGCQATSWEWLKLINGAFAPDPPPRVALVPLLPPGLDPERAVIEQIHDAMLAIAAGKGNPDQRALLEAICQSLYGHYVAQVRASDTVFFQAEGTMTGASFFGGAQLLLLPFVARHLWGKPVYAFNGSIFVCDERFAAVAVAAFNSFTFHAVREPASLVLAQAMSMAPVHHVPDAAFLTRPCPDARLPAIGEDCFAVTGSAFPDAGHREAIFAAADYIRERAGLMPVILASTGADRQLLRLAERHWPRGGYHIVPREVAYGSVAAALQRCRFLISGRYHLSILAATVGTPAIQVRGNSHKNEGLSALLDGLSPVHDAYDREAVVGEALAMPGGRDAHVRRLAGRVRRIRRALVEAQGWLAEKLRGGAPAMPASFRRPPGRAVGLDGLDAPYRAPTLALGMQLAEMRNAGRLKTNLFGPEELLDDLRASCEHGDRRSIAVLRQLHRSDPALRSALGRPDRARLLALVGGASAIPPSLDPSAPFC